MDMNINIGASRSEPQTYHDNPYKKITVSVYVCMQYVVHKFIAVCTCTCSNYVRIINMDGMLASARTRTEQPVSYSTN